MKKENTVQEPTKAMPYDALLASVASELKEAELIISTLQAYSQIHPITGVVYPEGTHKEMIKRAQEWVWRFRNGS